MFISINLASKEVHAIKRFVKALGCEPNEAYDANEEFHSIGYSLPEEGAGTFKMATNTEMTSGIIDVMAKYAPTIKTIFKSYMELCMGLFKDLDGLKKKVREETRKAA